MTTINNNPAIVLFTHSARLLGRGYYLSSATPVENIRHKCVAQLTFTANHTNVVAVDCKNETIQHALQGTLIPPSLAGPSTQHAHGAPNLLSSHRLAPSCSVRESATSCDCPRLVLRFDAAPTQQSIYLWFSCDSTHRKCAQLFIDVATNTPPKLIQFEQSPARRPTANWAVGGGGVFI